jgi:acetyltransferase-like isoleucine patch superfamily enzyme
MRKFIRFLRFLNLKTIYFNLKYLPLKQALKLPVLISNKVYLRATRGSVQINGPIGYGIIQIGYGNVGIFDKKRSRTIWEVHGNVSFIGSAKIGHGSKIIVGPNGKLYFGANFKITAEAELIAFIKVQFGNNCLLSWDTLIMDTDFHTVKNSKGEFMNSPKPIIIGDHVWLGCRSIILKGAVIPDNSIIAINSLVNKALPDKNCLYAGSPVKCIKKDVSWED